MSVVRARQGLTKGVRDLFSLDLRSLALFRVLIALAVLYNVGIFFFEAPYFLTDDGLYPREDAFGSRSIWRWSLYGLVAHAAWARALLLFTLAAALALLLGWKTRLATIVTWVLVVSLTNRIQIFNSGADVQLCVLLLWAMFLPLGARFSVDAALARDHAPSHDASVTSCFSIASVAILLQVIYVYFVGALLKTNDSWTSSFEAIYYALSAVQLSTPATPLLLSSQGLMTAMTAYVFWLELLAIFFLLMPRWYPQARIFVLPQLIAMHLGFLFFLSVGWFPLVSIAGLTLFIPALFWNRFLPWWNNRAKRRGIEIYYDRDCEFCRKTCLIFRELSLASRMPVAPAQDHASVRGLFEREQSWVVRGHDSRLRTHWDAVAYIWRRSPLLWPLGVLSAIPGLRWIGNLLYRLIGDNRRRLGKVTRALLPYRGVDTSGRLYPEATILVALLAVMVLWWNINTLETGHLAFPKQLMPALLATRLQQQWRMFARPPRSSDWTVVEGRTPGGQAVNLMQPRRQVPHERPHNGFLIYPHHRWRKYFERIDLDRHGDRVGRVFCGIGQRRGLELEYIEIVKYRQSTPKPGQPMRLPVVRAEYQVSCG